MFFMFGGVFMNDLFSLTATTEVDAELDLLFDWHSLLCPLFSLHGVPSCELIYVVGSFCDYLKDGLYELTSLIKDDPVGDFSWDSFVKNHVDIRLRCDEMAVNVVNKCDNCCVQSIPGIAVIVSFLLLNAWFRFYRIRVLSKTSDCSVLLNVNDFPLFNKIDFVTSVYDAYKSCLTLTYDAEASIKDFLCFVNMAVQRRNCVVGKGGVRPWEPVYALPVDIIVDLLRSVGVQDVSDDLLKRCFPLFPKELSLNDNHLVNSLSSYGFIIRDLLYKKH